MENCINFEAVWRFDVFGAVTVENKVLNNKNKDNNN